MITNDVNLAEVLKQIKPCDTQNPYIFVSYSSNDRELVWNDVLEFQSRGYNVWLDEKNLDKTKASWKEDALKAIEDMCCMLVVFYVSKSSLVSEACYNELEKTTDEISVAYHYGPVKFIAIDVEQIGNIGDFTRELHQSITSNASLSKDSKSKMMLTLHKFMKNFFDTNNEKVRIHPKNEFNRKMDYFDDILAAFPDSTCDESRVDHVIRAKILADSETEARIQAEVAKAKAEAEERIKAEVAKAKAEAELVARMKAEADAKAEAETKAKTGQSKQTTSSAGSDIIRDILGNKIESKRFTREQVEMAYKLSNQKHSDNAVVFMSVAKAGEKKIKNALNTYAKGAIYKDVVCLLDATLFGSAKEGILITNKALYGSYEKKQEFQLNFVDKVMQGSKDYYLKVIFKDGECKESFIPSCHLPKVLDFFETLLSMKPENYAIVSNEEPTGVNFYPSVYESLGQSKNFVLVDHVTGNEAERAKAIDKQLPVNAKVCFVVFGLVAYSTGEDSRNDFLFGCKDLVLTENAILCFDADRSTLKYQINYQDIRYINTKSEEPQSYHISIGCQNSTTYILNIATPFKDDYDNFEELLFKLSKVKK